MNSKCISSFTLACVGLAGLAQADVFEFKLQQAQGVWTCASQVTPTAEPLKVQVSLPPTAPAGDTVKLAAELTLAAGSPLTGVLTKKAGSSNEWEVVLSTTETKATLGTLSGTIDGAAVKCEAKPKDPPVTPPPASRARMTADDFAAADWLDDHDAALAAIRARVAHQNPKWPASRIVLLPHLPSGAKAPAYPTSISERDLAQVVMVVPVRDDRTIDWSLTRCESIPNYRVQGDIPSLAGLQAATGKRPRQFMVVRGGHALSCGADSLEYGLTITPKGGESLPAVVSALPVRPVYHLGATAMFGYDATKQSTFSIRDGKIDEAIDRVGPGLLVGGTYYINGVDFGDMRWYNHIFNPFLVVSLAAPKDRFVAGTALTYRGGISLGLGVSFNHVPVLPSGYTAGQAFEGSGDIPQNKVWKKGFYIGVAVDDKLFASFRKLSKSGTGGGTGAAADPPADAEDPPAEKPPADEPPADKPAGGGTEKTKPKPAPGDATKKPSRD